MIYAPFGCTATITIIAFLAMKYEKHEAWSKVLPVQEKGITQKLNGSKFELDLDL